MVKLIRVPPGMQDRVASIVQKIGLTRACKALNMCEKTVLRLVAGVPSTPGTIALLEKVLERLDVPKPKAQP